MNAHLKNDYSGIGNELYKLFCVNLYKIAVIKLNFDSLKLKIFTKMPMNFLAATILFTKSKKK